MSIDVKNVNNKYLSGYTVPQNTRVSNQNTSKSIFENRTTNPNADWFKSYTETNKKLVDAQQGQGQNYDWLGEYKNANKEMVDAQQGQGQNYDWLGEYKNANKEMVDAQQGQGQNYDWFGEYKKANKELVDAQSNGSGVYIKDNNSSTTSNGNWLTTVNQQYQNLMSKLNANPQTVYDENGNMTRHTYDSNGKVVQDSVYGTNGKLSQVKYYNADGTLKEQADRTYNNDGTIKDSYSDKDGKHTKDSYYNAYGKKVQDSYYNANDKMSSYIAYNADGSVKNTSAITYNSNGTIGEKIKDANGKSVVDIDYSSDKKITHYNTYEDGKLATQVDRRYNANGNMIDTVKDANGKFVCEQITDKNGKMTTKEALEEANVESSVWGDPHFKLEGTQAYDFQGVDGDVYKMLNNQDVTLNSEFGNWGSNGARVITDQNLEFGDEGINIVSHANGTFEIYNNGTKIGDQKTFNKDSNVVNTLKENNISLTYQNKVLKTVHDNRTISQTLNGSYINNSSTMMEGDTGLMSQSIGVMDNNADGLLVAFKDVNKDGKVNSSDVINYSALNQYFVKSSTGVAKNITNEIKAKIITDFTSGLTQGSAVKGFNTSHGYSALQWNEVVGENIFAVSADKYLV